MVRPWREICSPPFQLSTSKIKPTFLSINLVSLLAFEWQAAKPHFQFQCIFALFMASTGSYWAIYVYVCMNVCMCVFKSLKTKYNLWPMGGQPHTLAHRPDSQNPHALSSNIHTPQENVAVSYVCWSVIYPPGINVYSIYISNAFSFSYNTQQLELSSHKYILGKGRKIKKDHLTA